jgi:PKD repeat protein
MGMEHNPEDSSVGSNPDAASYPWSFAHYVSGSYRTVMSYSAPCSGGCTRVMRFSNPGILYNGYQTGIDGARDNAQTGDLTAPVIADFRVSLNQPSNVAPSASFSYTVDGLSVNFNDLSSDNDGSISARLWDFGDGTTSTSANPQHVYASAGTRTVTLTVTDDGGASDATSQAVTVSEPAAQPPAAPSDLSASATKSGKGKKAVVTGVTLQWADNSNNETHFVIEACQETGKGRNKSCAYSQIATVGPDVTSFEDASLVDYDRFRVKAVNDEGDSAYSNEARI